MKTCYNMNRRSISDSEVATHTFTAAMQTKHIDVMVRNVAGKFDEDCQIVNVRT